MTRKQKRLIAKHKDEVYRKLVEGFFSDAVGKTPEKILELYNRYEKVWIAHCNKVNHSTKEVHLHLDAFEHGIKINGHKEIKDSKVTAKSKIYALHLLHPIQGHSKFYYAMRDMGVWLKFIFFELKLN